MKLLLSLAMLCIALPSQGIFAAVAATAVTLPSLQTQSVTEPVMIEDIVDAVQNPAPADFGTFTTQWVSAGHMGHVVITKIENPSAAGIAAAAEIHKMKVVALAALFPPIPIPGSG